jgi:D-alanine-D-alanine ligase
MKTKEKIVVLYNKVEEIASIDEKDVIIQVDMVCQALTTLGFEVMKLPFSFDFKDIIYQLNKFEPSVVFNLVESVEGDGSLIYLAPALLDSLKIRYSGSSTEAIFLTTNKVLAKKLLVFNRIPTPGWVYQDYIYNFLEKEQYIIKPVSEDASIGINDNSVVIINNLDNLKEILEIRKCRMGKDIFAERFINGREFNVSILEGEAGPEVLPVPEIIFNFNDENKIKIIGYKAKWDQDSFEYVNTYRTFEIEKKDKALIQKLRYLSLKTWKAFGLTGFARIDFRVDYNNNPYVLEVNTNPSISPDSGFFAACIEAGFTFEEMIEKIIIQPYRHERKGIG